MPNRRPYLDSVTFHWEGAYRARDPVEPAAYGYNLVNFMRDVPSIWPQIDKRGMHPQVLNSATKITNAENKMRELAEALFDGVKPRTVGTNGHAANHSAEAQKYIESVKALMSKENYQNHDVSGFLENFSKNLPKFDKAHAHPKVVSLVSAILQHEKEARVAGEALFAGVGSRTEQWIKGRHTDQPIDHKPDTLGYLESVKRIIRPLTEENYNRKYGLGAVKDEYLRHEMMDAMYIRPHSGVWCLVYAARQAGILNEKTGDLGYKYIAPTDANIPAIMSGDPKYPLPDERAADRGKGRMYLPTKAPQQKALHDLAELINNASPEQKIAMRGFMHEARTKYFSATVQAEGLRAEWGDAEGKQFFEAHSREPAAHEPAGTRFIQVGKDKKRYVDEEAGGWLKRADDSYAYYYAGHEQEVKKAMDSARARQQAKTVTQQNENTYSWGDYGRCAMSLVGLSECKPTGKQPIQR